MWLQYTVLQPSKKLRLGVNLFSSAQGVALRPALTTNYSKQQQSIALYNTRADKGTGLPTGDAPWARIDTVSGYTKSQRTNEDWEQDEVCHPLASRRRRI